MTSDNIVSFRENLGYLVSLAAQSDADLAKTLADKIEELLSVGERMPKTPEEITPEWAEYVAGAVAAAWPKSWEVQAKRCNLAAHTIRQMIPYIEKK